MKERRRSIHPQMTVEWLREFKGFENYTEMQALEALDTIRSLANLMLGVQKDDENYSADELPRSNSIFR